jgi:hypothetical protein
MDEQERQKKIVEYLRIKSTSHGQIYTFQIAVPNPESVAIAPERFDAIRHSLTQQGTNLISLIVRRTEAYSEEEDYEVVYGADWCLVAKEIGIEKLWVWVFDMTDEQARMACQEMERLAGKSEATGPHSTVPNPIAPNPIAPSALLPDAVKQIELLLKRFEASVDRKLQDQFTEQFSSMLGKIERLQQQFKDSTERTLANSLGELFSKVETLEAAISRPQRSTTSASCSKDELKSIAKDQGIKILSKYTKPQIIDAIQKAKGITILSSWSKTQILDAIEKTGE